MKLASLTQVKDADTQTPDTNLKDEDYTVTVGTLDGQPVVVTPAGSGFWAEIFPDFHDAVDRAEMLGWDRHKAHPPVITDVD